MNKHCGNCKHWVKMQKKKGLCKKNNSEWTKSSKICRKWKYNKQ